MTIAEVFNIANATNSKPLTVIFSLLMDDVVVNYLFLIVFIGRFSGIFNGTTTPSSLVFGQNSLIS